VQIICINTVKPKNLFQNIGISF